MKLAPLMAIVLWIGMQPGFAGYDYSKGTKPSMYGKQVETTEQLKAVKDDDTIAMACKKCKAVTIVQKKEVATKPGKGTKDEAMTFDSCPGCKGKMTTQVKETKLTHSCSECGDDSAFCCATTKSEGETEGMKSH